MVNVNIKNDNLGREYLKFCEYKKNALDTNSLDLTTIDFFFPTLLLPLGIFIKNNDRINVIPPNNPRFPIIMI